MKIDFLIAKDVINGGGIEHYTRQVGRRLVNRGHEVTVYSTQGDSEAEPTLDGMRIIWMPRLRPNFLEKMGGAIGAAVHEFCSSSPDVVHLHSVAAGAMAGILRFRRAPCVAQMHGIEWQRSRWPAIGRSVLKELERLTFRHADAFTAVSKVQCDHYSRYFNVPVRYIPTAAEIKCLVEPKLILDSGLQPRRYVLSASRLVPEKGIHYLIAAFKSLETDWHLVIAGDGSEAYAHTLRELAGSDRRIHFTGYVKGRILEELFSNAGLYAQPSEIEGLAIALLEAMSFGLPCLVSDIPENREAIGNAGLTFKSKDIANLYSALEFAIGHQSLITTLGEEARKRVARQYSWDSVTESLETLYRDVSQRSAPGGAEEHKAATARV